VASALNLAFDRLHDSIERQRRFTADASHQLRTPVATMMAELDWSLMRERSAADYRESLETCRRAAVRMRSIVEGLLTLARADSGELPIRRLAVRIDEVIEQAIDSLRPLAAQRAVVLEFLPVPATVSGDPDRLLELITNLLFNGISYNRPEGEVAVAIEPGDSDVAVRIQDTGLGIDPGDLGRIFDRFYRAEAARAREPGGAGLGLALAKWIVDAHGGSLVCSSEPGQRTEFIIRLPAADVDAVPTAPVERPRLPAVRPPAVVSCDR
jgi:two-component system OmpR family sensor kinase